ncbi:maleylpyruvate isomerase family mycothiol-dependent enzyme [Georgenia muralis]|uniref:Uncharacterized protein (TIGR03083 family) n=1 Tax=Georgenia muralis TaxID=154117 RepID=A0A3N4Z311_9MICO|nr:maleylpyruvate isomerase family mycothiol-dependent enzyme [Georgenia muralis]RPF26224.1 uncharacterized protein (TIGR03083 family) [Georgenia muralis]
MSTTGHVGRDWAAFIDLLHAAGPDVWSVPTRLEGWDVADLARHAHWGMTLEAEALELAAANTDVADADAPAGAHDADRRARGVTHDGPVETLVPALRAARKRLLAALAAAPTDPGAVAPMPYGDLPMALALHIFVMEAALHRSDLAHALGDDDRLHPGTHAAAAGVLQTLWGTLAAAAMTAPPAGTGFELRGEAVVVAAEYTPAGWAEPTRAPAVVIGGDDDAVLLAAYGRLPLTSPRLRLQGDRELALRLKEFLPGP